jgi:hypothetical protein
MAPVEDANLVRCTADVGSGPVLIENAVSYLYNPDGVAVTNPSASVTAGDAGKVLQDAGLAALPGGLNKGRSDWSRSGVPGNFTPDGLVTASDAGTLLSEQGYLQLPGAQAAVVCISGTIGTRNPVCP